MENKEIKHSKQCGSHPDSKHYHQPCSCTKPKVSRRCAVITEDDFGETTQSFKTHEQADEFYEEVSKIIISKG